MLLQLDVKFISFSYGYKTSNSTIRHPYVQQPVPLGTPKRTGRASSAFLAKLLSSGVCCKWSKFEKNVKSRV
jgi:hypothetical protein